MIEITSNEIKRIENFISETLLQTERPISMYTKREDKLRDALRFVRRELKDLRESK